MARIPDAELQHLKSAVPLVAIIEQQGRQLFKRGKDMTVLCPFHQEKTPSMVITPSKNLYHCFGCNAGGSVLDWVMKTEGLSLRHAVERLRALLGHNPAIEPLVQPAELANEALGQQVLLSRVVEFYHHTLLNAPEAQAYLSKRRLNHPELVSQFKLGFANRTLGYRLPPKKVKAGAEIRARLQSAGVLRENGREHLRGSLVEAMSFWVTGHRNVTAAYGVNGVTADHWQAFEHYGIKQVLIAFDNDSAGNEAAVRLAAELVAKGITPLRVVFPPDQDANGYLCQRAEPETAFALLIESAVPMQDVAGMVALERQTPEPAPASSLVAEPVASVTPNVVCESGDNGELLISVGTLQWCLRGLGAVKVGSVAMKINAQVLDTQSSVLFADGVDLMSGRSRNSYARIAAAELGLTEGDLRRALSQVLLAVEQWQQQPADTPPNVPEMGIAEREAALVLLQDPYLTARITADLAACGVVGESTNLLAGFLAAVSRKLPKPLAVLIQSSSAAGKSSLMEAVLNLIPEEERIQYSAMTGQSLFYLGETNLQHKILAIAEEEGVRQAAYALKLLQSDGELTMASTGKDEATGNLVTKSYTVKGPVMLMLTTTAIDVDEELLNRCLVLTVNESREQTEAIHAVQRQKQTLEGLLAENERDYLTQLHQHAQRLLKPLNVVNPYASQLTFLSDKTRTRRDHMKYLTLIQSIALLHQHQREIKTAEHRGKTLEYIEVTKDDIRLANQLAHEILGRTLDEMPPQTRKLLLLIRQMAHEMAANRQQTLREVRFTRRDIRDFTQWSDNQLKVHCQRLAEMEYLLVHGGSRGHLLQYELLWDGDGDSAQVGQNEKSLFRQHNKNVPSYRTAGSLPSQQGQSA